jgi:hypothetical protein
MQSLLLFVIISLAFHTQGQALESLELAQAWTNARFTNCDSTFVDVINIKNVMALNTARKNACAEANFKDFADAKTLACFKTLNPTLQIFLNQSSIKLSDYGCKENPKFADYLKGDSKAIKAPETVYSASVSCTPADSKVGFKLFNSQGKNVCIREYKCTSKFRFGQSEPLDPAHYVFRCLSQNSVQSDCDQMNFHKCEGKEVSYSKLSLFGAWKADPVPVKASNSPTAN